MDTVLTSGKKWKIECFPPSRSVRFSVASH